MSDTSFNSYVSIWYPSRGYTKFSWMGFANFNGKWYFDDGKLVWYPFLGFWIGSTRYTSRGSRSCVVRAYGLIFLVGFWPSIFSESFVMLDLIWWLVLNEPSSCCCCLCAATQGVLVGSLGVLAWALAETKVVLGLSLSWLMVLAETQVGHLARVWLGKPTRIICNVMIFLVVFLLLSFLVVVVFVFRPMYLVGSRPL